MPKDEITEELVKDRAGKNRIPLILAITLAIVAIAVVVIVVVIQANSPQRKFKKLLDQGREFLSELKYEKAIASVDEVLKIDPKNEEALELKAEIYLAWAKAEEKAGNHEEAIKLAKEGYESTEDRQLKKLIEKLSKASETVKEAGEKEPEGTKEPEGAKETGEEPDPEKEEEEEDTFQIYLSFLTTDKLDEGVAYYQSMIQKDPTNTEAYLFGAALCLVKNDAASALLVLEAGIARGADKDLLLRKEAYVRENTILSATYKTKTESYEGEPGSTVASENTFYNDAGQEIRVEGYNGQTTLYDYNEYGDVIHYVIMDGPDKVILGEGDSFYQYNEKGDCVYAKDTYVYNGNYVESEVRHEYNYDLAGRKTREREITSYYYNDTYYEYDAKGNMIHEKQVSQYGSIIDWYYTYDENDWMVSSLCEGEVQITGLSKYTYDQRGNQIISDTPSDYTSTTYDLMDHPIAVDYDGDFVSEKINIQNVYVFKGDLEQVLR